MANWVSCDECGRKFDDSTYGEANVNLSSGGRAWCSAGCKRKAKEAKKAAKASKKSARAPKAASAPKEPSALGQASFAVGEKLGEAIGDGITNMFADAAEKNRAVQAQAAAEEEAKAEANRAALALEAKLVLENPEVGLKMREERLAKEAEFQKKDNMIGLAAVAVIASAFGLMVFLAGGDEMSSEMKGIYAAANSSATLTLVDTGIMHSDGTTLLFGEKLGANLDMKSETSATFWGAVGDVKCEGGIELLGNNAVITSGPWSGDKGAKVCAKLSGTWLKKTGGAP